MRVLTNDEMSRVSGGLSIPEAISNGLDVIWGALNGDAPGPSVFTGTATGPTPGGIGGRYPISALGQKPSIRNMPGGQLGRTIGGALTGGTGGGKAAPEDGDS